MNKPPPISLKIRSREASSRAREVVRGLDEKDRLRSRVRWLAVKSLISVKELRRDAAKLNHWKAEIELVETTLQKISEANR